MPIHDQILNDFKNDNLDIFYEKVHPGLVIYARKSLGDGKSIYAEDCVQNAILKAWIKRDHFTSIFALKSFLYVSIRNEILNMHRNDLVHNKYLKQLDDTVCFMTSVIDQEAKTMLFNAINNLPEKERQVLLMSYINNMKNAEIAAKLNLSLATVKRYKANSIEILKKQLNMILFFTAFLLSMYRLDDIYMRGS